MAILGLRDTSNFVADQRPKNYREGLLLLNPNGMAPLTALTSLMKRRKVDDPEFYWWEKEMQTRRNAITAAITTTTTGFGFASNAKQYKNGDLILVEETGEIVAVTADPTSDTGVTVQRGYAGTTPTALDPAASGKNPNVTVIGSAFEEGSLQPTGVNFDPTKKENYTQIFRSTLEMTRTASKTRLRTGDAVKEAKRECLEMFSNDMERAMWFGKKSSTTKNGKPLHTMAGVESFIAASNIKTADAAAGCSMDDFEEYLRLMFLFGSNEKMAFTGNRGLLTIQQIIRKNSKIEIMSGIKEFGMNVTKLFCPFGELTIKTHPLFNQMTGGTNTTAYYGRDSYFYVLDMKELQYVTFQDDDIKYQSDLQSNGLDGMQAGYIAEASMEMHFDKSHFLIKNLAKAKADA